MKRRLFDTLDAALETVEKVQTLGAEAVLAALEEGEAGYMEDAVAPEGGLEDAVADQVGASDVESASDADPPPALSATTTAR